MGSPGEAILTSPDPGQIVSNAVPLCGRGTFGGKARLHGTWFAVVLFSSGGVARHR
jgi:hypothetical protein